MAIQFSDYTFVPDPGLNPRGDGALLVPVESLPDGWFDHPPRLLAVEVDGVPRVFTGGGRLYYSDSKAGTEELAGWSYWERDASFDCRPGAAYVNLVVLAPGYDVADWPS